MLFCADVQDTKINRQSDVPTVKVVENQRADCATQTEKKIGEENSMRQKPHKSFQWKTITTCRTSFFKD